jgi:steroid delta-isomerase-like uncharacterized protein
MKHILFLGMIISLIIGSCAQNQESIAKLKELNAATELETQIKTVAQKIIDALNQRDTTYIELYAPDCKYYFPSSSTKPKSRAEDLQSSKNNWRVVPDIHWKIKEMVAEGNMVAARFTAMGTPQEEWFGVPPSDKKFESGGIFIVRIENGKVVEQWEDYDLLGTFMQLGMELKPADKKK